MLPPRLLATTIIGKASPIIRGQSAYLTNSQRTLQQSSFGGDASANSKRVEKNEVKDEKIPDAVKSQRTSSLQSEAKKEGKTSENGASENSDEGTRRSGENAKRTETTNVKKEIGGPPGPEPTRYGDWEIRGRATDF